MLTRLALAFTHASVRLSSFPFLNPSTQHLHTRVLSEETSRTFPRQLN